MFFLGPQSGSIKYIQHIFFLLLHGPLNPSSHEWKVFVHWLASSSMFLDAFSHLYKRVCPSVGRSVTHELKPRESAVFDQNYYQDERERILWPCIRPCSFSFSFSLSFSFSSPSIFPLFLSLASHFSRYIFFSLSSSLFHLFHNFFPPSIPPSASILSWPELVKLKRCFYRSFLETLEPILERAKTTEKYYGKWI